MKKHGVDGACKKRKSSNQVTLSEADAAGDAQETADGCTSLRTSCSAYQEYTSKVVAAKAEVLKLADWGTVKALNPAPKKWVSPQNHIDVFKACSSPAAGKRICGQWKDRLYELLEEKMNTVTLPAKCGGKATIGAVKSNLGGSGSLNCCVRACGPGTKWNSWPVIWDQDAMTPPQHSSNRFYTSPCPLPEGGIPKDAHMLRVSTCNSLSWNVGAFCVLIKLTKKNAAISASQGALVKGWVEVAQAPMDPAGTTFARDFVNAGGTGGTATERLNQGLRITRMGDTIMREAIATLRFEVASGSSM